MDTRELDKLRRLGLTEKTSSGAEGVRISAQHQRSLAGETRLDRRRTLQTWADDLNEKVAHHGGEIVPGSLSVAGQTVEAVVPVDTFEAIQSGLTKEGVRVDLVVPRQVVPGN